MQSGKDRRHCRSVGPQLEISPETRGREGRGQSRPPVLALQPRGEALIVEGEPAHSLLLSMHLAAIGCQSVVAAMPDEAFRMLRLHSDIRVVLTEVRLPRVADGLTFIRVLQQLWPEVRVVVVASNPHDLKGLYTTEYCPIVVLPKPVRARHISCLAGLGLLDPGAAGLPVGALFMDERCADRAPAARSGDEWAGGLAGQIQPLLESPALHRVHECEVLHGIG